MKYWLFLLTFYVILYGTTQECSTRDSVELKCTGNFTVDECFVLLFLDHITELVIAVYFYVRIS